MILALLTLAKAAVELGAQHVFVVYGKDGLDEITLTTSSLVAEVKEGEISVWEFDPSDVGLSLCPPQALKGGTPKENGASDEAPFVRKT